MKQRNGRINRILKNLMTAIGLLLAVLLLVKGVKEAGAETDWGELKEWAAEGLNKGVTWIWRRQYPAASFAERDKGSLSEEEKVPALLGFFLLYPSPAARYLDREKNSGYQYQEVDPAFKGYVESGRFYEEHSFLLYGGGEESGEDGSVNAGGVQPLAEENKDLTGSASGTGKDGEALSALLSGEGEKEDQGQISQTAPDPSMTCAVSPVWPVSGTVYRKEQLADYDFMMKHFYSVHASTTAGRDLMKASEFLAEDFTLEGGNDKPQILIYHTHSQEEFADYGPDNPQATVVGMGSYLTELLTQKGYSVIHDTSVYDLHNGKLDRNKAYTYALEGITKIVQKNPSIEVIIDLHRDGVNENLHMVNEVNGKPTAPIMFFNGVSQTPEGPIEYLPNPYREKNLAFSFQMQLDAAAYFPNLTRKIYLKGLRYNLHLRPRSTLVEVGAQTNTYEEALNAMEPLAEVLHMVLQGN